MELKEGCFYWILIALDPDSEGWGNEKMPARYDGGGCWNTLGSESIDWPVVWIGPEIKLG